MNHTRRGLFWFGLGAAALGATGAQAQWDGGQGFCQGFRAGWNAAFRNRNMPVGPLPPCPPPNPGARSYEAGFETGMMAALAEIRERYTY